ncbi:helix-turn-helix domain-containing protein [Nocardioides sp. cx-169]|uniref:PucR family transcriptional regulator n=1 Tax=Nocardioides sp. cx-169 TaxID=2899080 RepID=UPI001E55AC05|nr:helix-turn-helix domain-containing protein [Nocardioides sp. cx-169]MCD4536242.1 helix-turn-helix domain-containing protein [Nocardioides sp. cx-169]
MPARSAGSAVPRPAGSQPDDAAVLHDVEAAWAALRPRADEIADTITLTLLVRDSEVYERVGPELRVDVRDSTREHIRRGIEVLAGTSDAPSSAIELWRETGRRRARQLVPLETVLNAYTLGTRVLWEALVESGRTTGAVTDEHVLLVAGQRVWSALDVQNGVLVEAYRRESTRMQRQDLQRQQSALDALAEGRGADPQFAEEARDLLGIAADARVACVVALFDGSLDEPLGALEDRLERVEVSCHWHVRTGRYFGLLSGPIPDDSELVALIEPHATGRVGIAASPEGVAGFATAFQLATRAAETLGRGEARVVSVTDRLPEVLLAGSPQVTPLLMRETLGPLLAQPEPLGSTLLETLAALLRHDGSPTHAAEELFCHRNTVIYRARQIEEITGRTLTSPRDKMLLSLALMVSGR